jgi:hypothetical protein
MATTEIIGRNVQIVQETWEITYSELVAAASTQSISLTTALAYTANYPRILLACQLETSTVFTSGSITGLTVQIGQTADTDCYLTATELLSGPPSARCHADARVFGAPPWRDDQGIVHRVWRNLGNGTATSLTAGKIKVQLIFAKYKYK